MRAWDSFGYAPGTAFSATWRSVAAAYSALFEGAIFSPATISAAFHGGSIHFKLPHLRLIEGLIQKGLFTYGGRPKTAAGTVAHLYKGLPRG